MWRGATLIATLVLAPACDEKTRAETFAGEADSAPLYDVPELSPSQLDEALKSECNKAHAVGKPLLVEFSASWCGDCVRLAEMKREPALAQALKEVPMVSVNVGRFDQHESLLNAFGIKSIAHWQIVDTNQCRAPVESWDRRESRTLEPQSKKSEVTSRDLALWLKTRF